MSILNLAGAHENELETTGEFNPQAPRTALMLPSGQRVVVPTEMLLQGFLARAPEAEEHRSGKDGGEPQALSSKRDMEGETVIPLIEEQLTISKQQVETARVRVRRETEEHVQTLNVPLTDVRWEVEHIPVEQRVDTQPEIRQVGETIIFPLVEERMVVTRELWLREEVHVRKVKTTVEKTADFPVKRDVLIEERGEPVQASPDLTPR